MAAEQMGRKSRSTSLCWTRAGERERDILQTLWRRIHISITKNVLLFSFLYQQILEGTTLTFQFCFIFRTTRSQISEQLDLHLSRQQLVTINITPCTRKTTCWGTGHSLLSSFRHRFSLRFFLEGGLSLSSNISQSPTFRVFIACWKTALLSENLLSGSKI